MPRAEVVTNQKTLQLSSTDKDDQLTACPSCPVLVVQGLCINQQVISSNPSGTLALPRSSSRSGEFLKMHINNISKRQVCGLVSLDEYQQSIPEQY
jgi:hypothetical protein